MAAKTLTVAKRVCVSKYKVLPMPLNSKMGSMIIKSLGLVGLVLHLEVKRGIEGNWRSFDGEEGWGRRE